MLSDVDIRRIYENYVLVNNASEYLNRYIPLPLEKNGKRWKWEGKAFPRVITVLEFDRIVRKYGIRPRKLLMYNGGDEGDPELEYIQSDHVIFVNYKEATGENDLQTLDLPEKDFDFVLCAQTLEHLYDPIAALERLFSHMLPGGYLFTSVPVVNIQHSTPFHHYTGYTPVGLGSVCCAAGFEILEIGQWGNINYISLVFSTKTWPDYRRLGESEHPKGRLRWVVYLLKTAWTRRSFARRNFDLSKPMREYYASCQNGLQNEFANPVEAWILVRRPD
ncbi:MAG: methyltransferase domain-containing protein [Deltaproteobacteria bacterium]|nr:methyltransferase domain-containing protein [Deltaproteobacteria bacterium]